ncbi:DUF6660 family protein [Hymenobacter busanensis]|uniref:DUF6660 family protein n=1 Tax=Hymenobacter busanensis TaxID=2607656 RepID=UPI003B847E81
MRLLVLFFAFYFACLSCLSCADEADVCKYQTQTTVAATAHSDCSNGALGDWCSPFCQCHCCGGAVVPQAPLPELAAAAPATWGSAVHHGELVVYALTRATGSVWQPPQV